MYNVPGVIGIFLLGGAAGAMLKYARYRNLIAICNELVQRVQAAPPPNCGMVLGEGTGEKSAAVPGETLLGSTKLVWNNGKRALRNDGPGDFKGWAHNLLTCLGAPILYGEGGHTLTIAERVEWLQARNN